MVSIILSVYIAYTWIQETSEGRLVIQSSNSEMSNTPILVDTTVIQDPRFVDLVASGIVDNKLIIPRGFIVVFARVR